jgi:hypothetical protein
MLGGVKMANSSGGLHIAAEAYQPQKPIQWLVENLISVGSLLVFAGEAGCGKTYLLMVICACIAAGINFAGTFKTMQVPVLFIDEESGITRLNRRWKVVIDGITASPNIPLFYTSLEGYDLRIKKDLSALEKIIKDYSIGLVVMDALIDLAPGADENQAAEMGPFMQNCRTLAERTGAAICIIHHLNKAGGYRGSTAIKGAVDSLIIVEKKGNTITLKSEKSRDSEPFESSFEAHFEPDKFYLTSTGTATSNYSTELASMPKPSKLILEYLAGISLGQASKSELENLPGSTPRTLRDKIYDLAKQGYIERPGNGKQGAVAFYCLTKTGYKLANYAGWLNNPWTVADLADCQ